MKLRKSKQYCALDEILGVRFKATLSETDRVELMAAVISQS